MLRRNKPAQQQPVERWIEVDTSMAGNLTFKEPVNLRINGRFEGSLDAKGKLVVGQAAVVRADLRSDDVSIAGSVDGNITAVARLHIEAGARVVGRLLTPAIRIDEGAVVHGSIEMQATKSGSASWMNVDELASYLEVDSPTIRQWSEEGRLPAERVGDGWKFDRAKIEDWLAQERIK